jgi:hypothetical protein
MKRYINATTIRDMRIDAVSRTQYSSSYKASRVTYNVTYVNPNGLGRDDREYNQDNVPKRVLQFIENESVNTTHTEGNRVGWGGHYIYDVFWRKGTPEADVVNYRG